MKAQTEPQYFAISKEEWQEYQDLKSKKQVIDYDKLRTGSRVKVNLDMLTMATKKVVTSQDVCVIVLIDSPYMVNSNKLYEGSKNSLYTSLLFKGNYIHAVSTSKNYITKVIEY